MPDWPDDDLDLDAPLALPAELRDRLADALGADALAAALEGLDGPRPLSPQLRGRLEAALRTRHRRRPVVVAGGAVAAALVALAATVLALGLPGTNSGPGTEASRPSPAAGPARSTAGPAARPGATAAPSVAGPDGGQLSALGGPAGAAAAPEAGAPVVTRVAPAGGPAAGGNWVIVDGTGLAGADAVTFGDVPASFVVVSAGELRARAPAHGAGAVDVRVRTAAGTSPVTAGDRYDYA